MFAVFRRSCTQRSLRILSNYSKKDAFTTISSNQRTLIPVVNVYQNNLQHWRFKSKGGKNKSKEKSSESEESEEKDFLDDVQDKHTKIIKVNTTTMRLDAILKAGLGLSRNKIEVNFYESKIRLNGEKVMKKSAHVVEGDEIDLIRGANVNNPDFLTVARVEVLSAKANEEDITVKIRRCKSLMIENYKGANSWKG